MSDQVEIFLEVGWTLPDPNNVQKITNYNIRSIARSAIDKSDQMWTEYTDVSNVHDDYYTNTNYMIEELEPDSEYYVQIMAKNSDDQGRERVGPWSNSAAFSTKDSGYDKDSDGLIEIETIAQFNAIRYDLNGDSRPDQVSYQSQDITQHFLTVLRATICVKAVVMAMS